MANLAFISLISDMNVHKVVAPKRRCHFGSDVLARKRPNLRFAVHCQRQMSHKVSFGRCVDFCCEGSDDGFSHFGIGFLLVSKVDIQQEGRFFCVHQDGFCHPQRRQIAFLQAFATPVN